MKRGIRVLSAVAAVLALSWLPAAAVCPFSSPILQGGAVGGAANEGEIITAAPLGGHWWEAGFGDPAIPAGNDSAGLGVDLPAADAVWVSRTTARGFPAISWDWTNGGSDGCLSGGAGTGIMVAYLIDGGDDYAIVAVDPSALSPIPAHDFDDLVTGQGPNGNDVTLRDRTGSVKPFVTALAIIDDFSILADVGPAVAGVNYLTDAGGPYAGVVNTGGMSLLHRIPGGGGETPIPGCPENAGCNGVVLPRSREVCWDPGGSAAVAVGQQGADVNACNGGMFAGLPCPDFEAFCITGVGQCEISPGPVTPYGPPIPGGCILIAGPTVSPTAITHATKSRGFTVFTWQVDEFGVSQYNVVDTTRGGRRLVNQMPIQATGGNGSLEEYSFAATGRDTKGGKTFVLEMHLTDGRIIDTDF